MKKTTKTINIDGQQVTVTINHRETDGVWMFLHGWEGSRAVWQRVTRDFPATTVAVDLPGFGNSDGLSEPWTTSDYSQTIRKLVEALDLHSVVLVGHSFGGQVATYLASQKPDWLDGLVLVSAAVVRNEEPRLLSYVGRMLSPLFQLPVLHKLRGPLYDLIGADRPPENENLKKTMQRILREDQTDKLPQVNVPTKIIWGGSDSVVGLDKGRLIAKQIPQSDLLVLPGGHHIFIDTPDAFQEELVDFYNKLQS